MHATIPKGIVGGFELTIFQRDLKERHESHGPMFASAKEKQQKVGSTATASGTVC